MSDTYKVYCVKNFYLTNDGDYGFSQYTKVGVSKDLYERTKRFSESGPVKVLWTITCKTIQTANALEKHIKERWQRKFLYPCNLTQYQNVANFHSELFQLSLNDAHNEFFNIIKKFKLDQSKDVLCAETGFKTLFNATFSFDDYTDSNILIDFENNGLEKFKWWNIWPRSVYNHEEFEQYNLFDNENINELKYKASKKYFNDTRNEVYRKEYNYYNDLISGFDKEPLTFAKVYENA
jgi:hypothetical protein